MCEAIFDYYDAAVQAGIDQDTLSQIIQEAQSEFPFDEMMKELHIIRAISSYAAKSKRAAS